MPRQATTRPAEFVWSHADLQPVDARLLRLAFARFGDHDLRDVLVLRSFGSTVLERTGDIDRPFLNHTFVGNHEVALVVGDILDADNGTFGVATFGLGQHGSEFRYSRHHGLTAATEAVTKWAARKYRAPHYRYQEQERAFNEFGNACATFVATYGTDRRPQATAVLGTAEVRLQVLVGAVIQYPSLCETPYKKTLSTVREVYDNGDIRCDADGVRCWGEYTLAPCWAKPNCDYTPNA